MYFIFSFSIHNYRSQLAWKELEEKSNETESSLGNVNARLENDAWVSSLLSRVEAAKDSSSKAAILKKSLKEVLLPLRADGESDVQVDEALLNDLAKEFVPNNSTTSANRGGKMI